LDTLGAKVVVLISSHRWYESAKNDENKTII
jgi:hypothetical protein